MTERGEREREIKKDGEREIEGGIYRERESDEESGKE